jgi:TfoX/Sxy family transcriptional regulator of competence genes
MSETYLRSLISLIERLGVSLNRKDEIQCKHFFGGAAAYCAGRIFMTLTSRGLALKLPKDSRELLISSGAMPLRYFTNAPTKKDYVVLPRSLADDMEALAPRINESIRFVQTLPKRRSAKDN